MILRLMIILFTCDEIHRHTISAKIVKLNMKSKGVSSVGARIKFVRSLYFY